MDVCNAGASESGPMQWFWTGSQALSQTDHLGNAALFFAAMARIFAANSGCQLEDSR